MKGERKRGLAGVLARVQDGKFCTAAQGVVWLLCYQDGISWVEGELIRKSEM